jgi:hypothetical protein
MEWLKDTLNGFWQDVKRAYVSMTIWVNGIALTVISILPLAQDYAPQLQAYISPDLYKQMMLVLVIANILLRFKTSTALRDK